MNQIILALILVGSLVNAKDNYSIDPYYRYSRPCSGISIHNGKGMVAGEVQSILKKNGYEYFYVYEGEDFRVIRVGEGGYASVKIERLFPTNLVDLWEEGSAMSLLLVDSRGYHLAFYGFNEGLWGRSGFYSIANTNITFEGYDETIESIALTSLYDVEIIKKGGVGNLLYSVASGELLENGRKPSIGWNSMSGRLPDLTSKKKMWIEFDPADQEPTLKKVDKAEEPLVESAENDVMKENWNPLLVCLVALSVLSGLFVWRFKRSSSNI